VPTALNASSLLWRLDPVARQLGQTPLRIAFTSFSSPRSQLEKFRNCSSRSSLSLLFRLRLPRHAETRYTGAVIYLVWLALAAASPSPIPPAQPATWWSSLNPSVIGGFVGGLTGGSLAIMAQIVANLLQRSATRGSEKRVVRGTLKAMMVELTVLKTDFVDRVTEILEQRKTNIDALKTFSKDVMPLQWTPAEQSYFTIFDSNASVLGRLDDDDLRESIVRVYGSAKGLFDGLNANPPMFARWLQLPEGSREKSRLEENLNELEKHARRDTAELADLITRVVSAMEEFLRET
jgi:hypothetical protein